MSMYQGIQGVFNPFISPSLFKENLAPIGSELTATDYSMCGEHNVREDEFDTIDGIAEEIMNEPAKQSRPYSLFSAEPIDQASVSTQPWIQEAKRRNRSGRGSRGGKQKRNSPRGQNRQLNSRPKLKMSFYAGDIHHKLDIPADIVQRLLAGEDIGHELDWVVPEVIGRNGVKHDLGSFVSVRMKDPIGRLNAMVLRIDVFIKTFASQIAFE